MTSVYCDCDGPPWPEMPRLNAAGLNRYYLCRRCGTVREDLCRHDGTIISTRRHNVESADLPAAVVEQARAILDAPRPKRAKFEKQKRWTILTSILIFLVIAFCIIIGEYLWSAFFLLFLACYLIFFGIPTLVWFHRQGTQDNLNGPSGETLLEIVIIILGFAFLFWDELNLDPARACLLSIVCWGPIAIPIFLRWRAKGQG